ncbi:MAG TPA: hypothetical protein VH598_14045 [Verrucomicrobiae bacterium]|nr:hypothetical protein [Verrucomicrobiae bacterium]
MSSDLAEMKRWPPRRWCAAIGLVLLLQVGPIFWFADQRPNLPRPAKTGPVTYLTDGRPGQLAMAENPTLFALASRHGFSSAVWLKIPPPENPEMEWSEPPRFLEIQTGQMAGTFKQFTHTNLPRSLEIADLPEPSVDIVKLAPTLNLMPTQSILRIEGSLARRPMLAPLVLKSWPASDLLTHSEVRVAVDQDGYVNSAILLSRSGLPEADNKACELAKSARFQALRTRKPGESPAAAEGDFEVGTFVFQWHSVPEPATNSPPAIR